MKTKQITLNAVLAAMCAVLGAISLDFGNIKISFEGLPVMIGALLFGPVDGFLIGGIGTLIYQVLRYGFEITTMLWVLPYALCGIIMGAYAKKRGFNLTKKQMAFIVCLGCVLIFLINTASLVVYSMVYQLNTPVFILGALPVRILVCIINAVGYSAVMPILIKSVRRVV